MTANGSHGGIPAASGPPLARIERAVSIRLVALLASACQFVGAGGPRVSFHGDSMGAQADAQITHRLTVSHRLFRQSIERADIADLLPGIRRLIQRALSPDIVTVELGSGDAYERHGVARFA